MRAFLSYHHSDRHVAAKICKILEALAIETFMAHDDIAVSHEWHDEILAALSDTDVFIAVLSAEYIKSHYCLQESGIAIFRKRDLTVIPLSKDGTLPPGFMNRVQSKIIDPDDISEEVIFSGIAKHNLNYVVSNLTEALGNSGTYATAEDRFARLEPFLKGLPPKLAVEIFRVSDENSQVWFARANRPILRQMLKDYGAVAPEELVQSLTKKVGHH